MIENVISRLKEELGGKEKIEFESDLVQNQGNRWIFNTTL